MARRPINKRENEAAADTVGRSLLRPSAGRADTIKVDDQRGPRFDRGRAGEPLSPGALPGLAPESAAALRVHTSRDARNAARAFGARAFALGNHLFFARSEDASAGSSILAHEAGHAVLDGGVGRLERYVDPTLETLWPEDLTWETDADLLSMEQAAVDALALLDDPERERLFTNLAHIQGELRVRGLPIQRVGFARTTTDLTQWATEQETLALQVMIDLLITLAEEEFTALARAELVAWLEQERSLLPRLRHDAVLAEGDLLEAMFDALTAVAAVRAAVPQTPSAAASVAEAQRSVDVAIMRALEDLHTSLREQRLRELDAAVQTFVDAYSSSLIGQLAQAKIEVEATPSFGRDDDFIGGYARGNQIYFGASWDELGAYQVKKEWLLQDMLRLAAPDAAAPLATRIQFLSEHEAALRTYLSRAQAIVLLARAFEMGRGFMSILTSATDQITWSDVADAIDLRERVVRRLGANLDTPTQEQLSEIQAALSNIGDDMYARFEETRQYIERVNTALQFVTMVASLYGGGLAMRAALGPAAANIGTRALTASQLVRGSLAFTWGSSLTTMALTGQVPTWQELLLQAEMDLATFGLMHVVNLRLATAFGSPTAVPPLVRASAEFATLWAWSTAVAVGSQLLSGNSITAAQARQIASESAMHTAMGFAAMGVAHHIAAAPAMARTASPDPALEAARRVAFEEYERVRADGLALETEIRAAAERGEGDLRLDSAMRRAEGWYGSFSRAIDGLAHAGVVDIAGAEAIKLQTRSQIDNVRSVRDANRLGLRATSDSTVAFSGAARNLELYLSRQQRLGAIEGYAPTGRSGMYRVTLRDGSHSYWYPEGGTVEAQRGADFAAQYLADAYPELSVPARGRVMAALGEVPGANVGTLIAGLTGPNGRALVEFLSAPAAGEVLATSSRGGEVLAFALEDASLRVRLAAEGADLVRWNDLPYEQIYGRRDARAFASLLSDVAAQRGSLSATAEQRSLTFGRLRDGAEASGFSRHEPTTIRAPGPRQLEASDHMRTLIRERGLAGEFRSARRDDGHWFFQVVDGVVERAFQFAPGASAPVEIDVAAARATLQSAVDSAGREPERAAAILAAARPTAERIAPLRELRGLSLSTEIGLIDRVLPVTAIAVVPAVERAPAPEPSAEPLVAVTTRGRLAARRAEVLGRARRMGLLDAAVTRPELDALTSWNPRDATTAPADPAGALASAESLLETEVARATRQARRNLGARTYDALRAEFADATSADEAMRLVHGRHHVTRDVIRGLAYASQAPPAGEAGVTIRAERIFELAPSARDARLALETFARLRDAGIPGAHRLLSDMVASRSSFRGGLFTLRAIADGRIPIGEVATLELPATMTVEVNGVPVEIGRRYDVVLTSGERVEMKSWTRWFPDTIRSQFGRDAVLATDNFRNPGALREIRWIFEDLPTVTEGTPPRTRRMTDAEARSAVLAQMEAGIRDQGAALGKSAREIERAIETLRAHQRRIINIAVLATGTTP